MLLFQETPANHPEDCQRYAQKVAGGYRPAKPFSVPMPVWDVVQRCWSQDPKVRPSMEEVLLELLAIEQSGELEGGSKKGRGGTVSSMGRQEVGARQGCACCVIS